MAASNGSSAADGNQGSLQQLLAGASTSDLLGLALEQLATADDAGVPLSTIAHGMRHATTEVLDQYMLDFLWRELCEYPDVVVLDHAARLLAPMNSLRYAVFGIDTSFAADLEADAKKRGSTLRLLSAVWRTRGDGITLSEARVAWREPEDASPAINNKTELKQVHHVVHTLLARQLLYRPTKQSQTKSAGSVVLYAPKYAHHASSGDGARIAWQVARLQRLLESVVGGTLMLADAASILGWEREDAQAVARKLYEQQHAARAACVAAERVLPVPVLQHHQQASVWQYPAPTGAATDGDEEEAEDGDDEGGAQEDAAGASAGGGADPQLVEVCALWDGNGIRIGDALPRIVTARVNQPGKGKVTWPLGPLDDSTDVPDDEMAAVKRMQAHAQSIPTYAMEGQDGEVAPYARSSTAAATLTSTDELTRLMASLDKEGEAERQLRARYPVCLQLCILAHPALCIHRMFPALAEQAAQPFAQYNMLSCVRPGASPGSRDVYAVPLATLLQMPACQALLWACTRTVRLEPAALLDVHLPDLLQLLLQCAGHAPFRLGDVVVAPSTPAATTEAAPSLVQLVSEQVKPRTARPPVTTMEVSTEHQIIRAACMSGEAGVTSTVIRNAFGLRPKTMDTFMEALSRQRMLVAGSTWIRKTRSTVLLYPRPMPQHAADAALRSIVSRPFDAAHVAALRTQLATPAAENMQVQLSAGGTRRDLIAGMNAWTALQRVDERLSTAAVVPPFADKPSSTLYPLATLFSCAIVQRMLVKRVGRAEELVFILPEASSRACPPHRGVAANFARHCADLNHRSLRWMYITRVRAPLIDPAYLAPPMHALLASDATPADAISDPALFLSPSHAETNSSSIAERALSRVMKLPRQSNGAASTAMISNVHATGQQEGGVVAVKRKRGRPAKPKGPPQVAVERDGGLLEELEEALAESRGEAAAFVLPQWERAQQHSLAEDVLGAGDVDVTDDVLDDVPALPPGAPVDDIILLRVAIRESIKLQVDAQQSYLSRLAAWEEDWAAQKGAASGSRRHMPVLARTIALPDDAIARALHVDAVIVKQRLQQMPRLRPDLIAYERALHTAQRSAAGVGWYSGPVWAVTLASSSASVDDTRATDLHHFDAAAITWLMPGCSSSTTSQSAALGTAEAAAPLHVIEHGSMLWSCVDGRARATVGATNMLLTGLVAVDAAWSSFEEGFAPVAAGQAASAATTAVVHALGDAMLNSGATGVGAAASAILYKVLTTMEQQGWLMRVTAGRRVAHLRKRYASSQATLARVLATLNVNTEATSDAAVEAAITHIEATSVYPRWEPTLLYSNTSIDAPRAQSLFSFASLTAYRNGGQSALATISEHAAGGGMPPAVVARLHDDYYQSALWDMACVGDRVWPATVSAGPLPAGTKRHAEDAADGDEPGKKSRRRVDLNAWPEYMSHVRLRLRDRPVVPDVDTAFSALLARINDECDTMVHALLYAHAADMRSMLQEHARSGLTATDALVLLARANAPALQRLRDRLRELSSDVSDASVCMLALRRAMATTAASMSLAQVSSAVGDVICPPDVAPCFAVHASAAEVGGWRDVHVWSVLPGGDVDASRAMRLLQYLLHVIYSTGPIAEGKLVSLLPSMPPGSLRKLLRFLLHARLLTVRHHVVQTVPGPAPAFADIAWLQREVRAVRAPDVQRAVALLWNVAPAVADPTAVVMGTSINVDPARTPDMDVLELQARLADCSSDAFPLAGWSTTYTLHPTCFLRAASMFGALCKRSDAAATELEGAAAAAEPDEEDSDADDAAEDAPFEADDAMER